MIHIHRIVVAIRRQTLRYPWAYWALVLLIAAGTALLFQQHIKALDDQRSSWGETRSVLIATRDIAPGDPLDGAVAHTDVPLAVAPEHPLTEDGRVAKQHISPGEIISTNDVGSSDGPLALVPEGWLAVPVVESPPSGATPGEHVQVVSDGLVVGYDAIVVALNNGVTLVAVSSDIAPMLPLAAESGSLTLLRMP